MTTEVLRNMIYAASPALDGLRSVVLDEVHYLQDRYRGPVWEEVIVHLDSSVELVCLSATVSNAEEVVALDRDRARPDGRGHRGAPSGDPRAPLPGGGARPGHAPPAADVHHPARPAPCRTRTPRSSTPVRRVTPATVAARARRCARPVASRRSTGSTPRSMLPAIVFVFSRAGCDQAVQQCLAAGLRLTDPAERAQIRAIAEEKTQSLADADLDVLRYDELARRARGRVRRAPRGNGAADEGGRGGGVRGRVSRRWCSRRRRSRSASTCRLGRW